MIGQEPVAIDLLAALDLYRPDVVLWDLGWDPDPKAVRTTSQAIASLSAGIPPVAALLPDAGDAGAFATDLRATGVRGLLLRNARPQTLTTALSAVAAGLVVLDPTLQDDLPPVAPPPPAPLPESLTPREQEVLRLLAEGAPNKAIAHQLGISEHTVKFHVNAIMGKLGAQSRTEAVVRATRLGLVLL